MTDTRNSATCGGCQHWQQREYDDPGWGMCQRAGSRDGLPTDQVALAVAQDVDSFGAHLDTRQDFGCVLWAA